MVLENFLPLPTVWVLIFFVGVITFYIVYLRQAKSLKMLSKIPGPPKLPILGNVFHLNLFKEYNTVVIKMLGLGCVQYRGFYWIQILHLSYIVVSKPSIIEKILTSSIHINKSLDYTMLSRWLGNGLLTSRAEKWSQRRKMLTPTFHFRILDDFLDIFNEQTKIFTQILYTEFGNGKVFDICPYVTRCALDIISETAMGKQIHAQKQRDTDYMKAVYRISELIQYRQLRPWFHLDIVWYNLSALGREETKCLKILHGFTNEVIKSKKIQLEKLCKNKKEVATVVKINPDEDLYMSGKKRLAFLDLLLESQEENKLSDTDIREETDTFMFEGHDTTASSINWTIFLLASYPEYQVKVHEELDSIFGDDRERPVTSQDITQMKYLECCIKESLRLYPSVPFIGRSIEVDLQLDDEITIPAGSTAFIMTYQLHRDPEVFPEPEVFLPDRFFPDSVKGRSPFAYAPFSAGPRNCIGQKFAMMEEKVMIANFFRNFKAEPAERREDKVLLAEIILRPRHGLLIKIYPR